MHSPTLKLIPLPADHHSAESIIGLYSADLRYVILTHLRTLLLIPPSREHHADLKFRRNGQRENIVFCIPFHRLALTGANVY